MEYPQVRSFDYNSKSGLELDSQIESVANQIKGSKDVYILGRSLHFPICLEGGSKD